MPPLARLLDRLDTAASRPAVAAAATVVLAAALGAAVAAAPAAGVPITPAGARACGLLAAAGILTVSGVPGRAGRMLRWTAAGLAAVAAVVGG